MGSGCVMCAWLKSWRVWKDKNVLLQRNKLRLCDFCKLPLKVKTRMIQRITLLHANHLSSPLTVWLWWCGCPSGHPHHRVLSGMYLQHGLLSPSLGPQLGSCAWVITHTSPTLSTGASIGLLYGGSELSSLYNRQQFGIHLQKRSQFQFVVCQTNHLTKRVTLCISNNHITLPLSLLA